MDEVAAAISDPIRREILEILHETRLTAGAIAERFSVSRPAISRHLRVLRAAGLVHDEPIGRERYYTLDTEPLNALTAWITRINTPTGWENSLDALETEVYRTRRERRTETAHNRAGTTAIPRNDHAQRSDHTRKGTA